MPNNDELAAARMIVDLVDSAVDVEVDATPAPAAADKPARLPRRKRKPQRDTLIGIADSAELWHDANRVAYASYSVADHVEHWPVRSRDFRIWLSGQFYRETGQAISGTAIEDGLRIMEARAINDGPRCEPFIRVGRAGGNLYLDLADEKWRAVEISAEGWAVVERPTVRFLRTPAMRPLPPPEQGGMVEGLRPFLNTSDDDAKLIIAWLVACLRDRGPYPLLVMNGEQGSGKSILSRMIRSLIDPSAPQIRALPTDERDIVISASNSYVLCFDNLSGLSGPLSDALCRLSTGGGFATRALHTNAEEMIFEAMRPILLNGIPQLADRADLSSRAITVHLRTIGAGERRAEDDLWPAFEAARPGILAGMLDGASAALRGINSVALPRLPRMADFAKWVTAAESGLGWEPETFLPLYETNMRAVEAGAFEADMVAVAIRDAITWRKYPNGFRDTPAGLLAILSAGVADSVKRSRGWPVKPQQMGNAFDRAAPLLRSRGFVVERHKSEQRMIVIIPPTAPIGDEVPV